MTSRPNLLADPAPVTSASPDASPRRAAQAVPLCLDLDGTLLKTDLLFESLARLLCTQPWSMLLVPFWCLQGKAVLKRELAKRVKIDVKSLPYNQGLLDWAKGQRESGRGLWLVTGADEMLAGSVAAQLGILNEVIASDGRENLTGVRKLNRLRQRFGGSFAYAGDSRTDLEVWKHAQEAVAVGASRRLLDDLRRIHPHALSFDAPQKGWKPYASAMRIHQWPKNVLVFVPLIAAHQGLDLMLVWKSVMSVLLFSMAASAQYILNDLIDLESDRKHTLKRHRPFASGELPLAAGFALVPVLLGSALLGAFALAPAFAALLAAYFLLSLSYSLHFKRIVLLDAFMLSGLYIVRMVAGHVVTNVAYSVWLLSFAFFLFLSLALNKRWMELSSAASEGNILPGRGYQVSDCLQVNLFGVCSAFLSTVIFILYLQSETVRELYRTPQMLWFLAPVYLYWLSRLWIVSGRNSTGEDPVLMVLKDRTSYAVAAIAALILIAATSDIGLRFLH